MINIALFGLGHVGQSVADTLAVTPDMKLVGVVSVHGAGRENLGVAVVPDERGLPSYDVALLARPSRDVPELAAGLLAHGVRTVDSFDIHAGIPALRHRLDGIAKACGTAAVISAGWDPGTDSVVRALLEMMAPRGITHTNFGPGMSLGHTVAARAVRGVEDALSLTLPAGAGLHKRVVYVKLSAGHRLEEVAARIRADDYFSKDETAVLAVEDVAALRDRGHGVLIERQGESGKTANQRFRFDMRINNPALTAQVMVCAARAVMRQSPGGYTLIEIPPVDFLPCTREEAVARLV